MRREGSGKTMEPGKSALRIVDLDFHGDEDLSGLRDPF